ncbi:protein of unknown function DUF218 [Desulfonatronospira thiodismutans ASO3-1]|uniref:DUF218 domain-containing protein n=1 Tax=Desulfonatronospira thiodismutans ASO3-1 TaxID=555779 RepID=D6SL21_9BACT|nr:envelope biogenesis factor ElyC [Desulfonatronospira thiodismutans]EFI35382.1 protein of unknown function DUF218 [Desulfonatronospira thiodismutans ASO3-1]
MEVLFVLKKVVSRLVFPLPLALQVILLGLIFIIFKRNRTGFVFILAGTVFLGAISVEPVADRMLRPLEQKYQPLQYDDTSAPSYIVVLGSGHFLQEGLPPNALLSQSSLSRVVEGIRIKNMYPDSTLVFTGGRFRYPVASSELAALASVELGIDENDILVVAEAKDTEDEASLARDIVGDESFVLVTSASHMHRSMIIFKSEGMDPIPSPTDFRAPDKLYNLWDYFPSAGALAKTERVFYERLGLAWAMIRGIVPE